MMRSMYAGVSGLKVHQTKMDVIGNNISNVNTTGYKGSRVTFVDMLSQTLQGAKAPQNNSGGVNPQQVGLGVSVGSIDINHTEGNHQTTGYGNDLAIEGNGYFVVNNGQQNFYTRAGALTVDKYGNLVNAGNGYIMQGWMADANGNINTDLTIEGLRVPFGDTMPGKSTTQTSWTGNLDSRLLGGRSAVSNIDIFDSLGGRHTMTIEYVRRLDGPPTDEIRMNSGAAPWTMSATATVDDPDINGLEIKFAEDDDGPPTASYDAASHTITLTGDWDNSHGGAPADALALQGVINTELTAHTMTNVNLAITSGAFAAADLDGAPTLTLISAANIWDWEVLDVSGAMPSSIQGNGTITFNTDGTFASQSIANNITFNPNGPATMGDIGIDFSAMTQSSGDSTVEWERQDGYAMGFLDKYSINDAGQIIAGFTNGHRMALAQIAIANFNNPYGLLQEGDTLFSPSQNSGDPQIDIAGSGGRGTILSGRLEMSNVDLAQQFTEMITAQRGFQANSKIITTSDQMLQELVNLKR